MPDSIKLKLILFNLLTFSLLLAFAGSFLYLRIEESVLASIDGHLHSEVQLIAALFEEEEGYFEVELAEANIGEFSTPLSGHYYQVLSLEGDLVARSPSLSIPNAFLPEAVSSPEAYYTTITGPGRKKLRMVSQVFEGRLGSLKIEAAEPLGEADALLHSLLVNTLLIFIGAEFFSVPCIWFLAAASLKKLEMLSKKVSEVTEKSLNEPVEYNNLDRELKPLARSFNGLLSRLDTAFKRQRDFLSNASHDLKTPVTVIKTSCEVTLSKERTPGEYRDSLRVMLMASKEMALSIDKVLISSRLDSDAFHPAPSRVDLKRLASEVTLFLEPQASAREVTLSVTARDIEVVSDEEMLREVLLNIVENAIKYNRKEGRVDVEVDRTETGAVISIADTGIGIPEDELANIFSRYYRVSQRGRGEKGCGLGLSIAEELISKCGGKIEVESKPGSGTRFRILLRDSPS